ncbi:hypothetical protein BDR05DRAFT_1001335 [Suillus weaverae]|nr:hypothetical protein BDR05DRAFT_1001335 [Suillus weaverae]
MPFEIPFFIEGVYYQSSYHQTSIQINSAVSTAPPKLITIHEGSSNFNDAARSLADKCLLHCYKGVYYNIPVRVNHKQLLFYVIRSSHIGIIAGWENALNCVLGVKNANYREVESIAIGEQLVREAIDQGRVEMVEPWASS